MKKFALIVAGGIGSRMQSELPKQFMEIHSLPIIIHTIKKFIPVSDQIILVLPKEFLTYWSTLKEKYLPNVNIVVSVGGATRTQSVKNGMMMVDDNDSLVAIHDAARPFVSIESIQQCYKLAEQSGSGVLAVPLKDSIRKLETDRSIQCDRTEYVLMQTPQTFQVSLFRKALEEVVGEFTDDASLVEATGHKIILVEGTYENIKITTPEDILIGEAIFGFQTKTKKS
jgi:2-C-methyl-D-erythritol 4-phosphate cytidylyltransferase